MATTYSKFWKNKVPIPLGNGTSHLPVLDLGTSAAVGGTITLGSTNDVLKICTLPERVTCGSNFAIIGGDHDTNATPTIVVTLRLNDGTTQKPLISASTVLQAGGIARPSLIVTTETGVGFTTNSKLWWLELLIATQAATGAAARLLVQLDLSGFYTPGAVTE